MQAYGYDGHGRMTSVRFTGHHRYREVAYEYDGLGRRTGKTLTYVSEYEPARRTDFYWQGMRLCGERSSLEGQSWYFYHEGSHTPLARFDCGEGDEGGLLFVHAEANGMPVQMSNEGGETVWQAEETELYGRIRREKSALPAYVAEQHLRFAGQYHDKETGLHYNTMRYYDPDAGRFTQPDPIGLAGGINLYAYGPNPITWIDPLGLTAVDAPGYSVYGLFDPGATKPYYVGITDDPLRRAGEHRGTGRLTTGSEMVIIDENVKYGQARGYEQYYIEKYKTRTGTIGEDISKTNRGNKYNSFDHGRTDARADAFRDAYDSRRNGSGKKGRGGC